MSQEPPSSTIRAAGGVVWEDEPWQSRIVIIYRNRYSDWSLPKGKLEEGESFEEAAIREIREETGCTVHLHSFAGEVQYNVKGRSKIVKYWHAALIGEPKKFEPNQEVAAIEWLNVDDALGRLAYESERALLRGHDNSLD